MIFKAIPATRFYEPDSPKPIDGITSTTRGHEIILRFLQPRTVVSGDRLRLSGSLDAEMKTDDLLCLVYDGASWHETSRVVK